MASLNNIHGGLFGKLPMAMTLLAVATAALVSGCNVGKTDTVAGTTTTGTSTSTGTRTCTGSYIGSIVPPSHEVRIANRNRQLTETGFAITGNDAVDNANTTGGGVDGGIYLEGSFAFETDANCNVIKNNGSNVFGFPITITGKVNADLTFNLYDPEAGPFIGAVDANNVISGQQQEGGKDWVHGVLVGKFTPNGKV